MKSKAIKEGAVKEKSTRNKTLFLEKNDHLIYGKEIIKSEETIKNYCFHRFVDINKIIYSDFTQICHYFSNGLFDLIILDPPHTIKKDFLFNKINEKSKKDYLDWFESWFKYIPDLLTENGSCYIFSDWVTSLFIEEIVKGRLYFQNRITFNKNNAVGIKDNWKNSMEDIFFLTKKPKGYIFNVEKVKSKKKTKAFYNQKEGDVIYKDKDGDKYLLTEIFPPNLWNDIVTPFWSMPENTVHPNQRSEKLIERIILASTNHDSYVLDPFLGSGTTSLVCEKLGLSCIGVEKEFDYCLLSQKRLSLHIKTSK